MKVLVTGADGFIGSHLVESLVRLGHQVRAFVFYNSYNSLGWLDDSEISKSVDIFSGDIRDPRFVDRAVAGQEVVLHLAALIGIPFSYLAPDSYVDTNIKGTLNLLHSAREHEVQRFIQTSTSEVYGSAQYVPIDEAHPLNPQSPYAASKVGSDQLALSFHRSFELPVGVLRPFNTFGPRQSARAVIPTIISQLRSGPEVRLGSLEPTRDFTFVDDTVAGFLAAAESPEIIGEVVNLGSGFEISIEETAKMIANMMGKELVITSDSQRIRPANSEVDRLFASVDKAKRILDWRPSCSGREGFKVGLKKTIEWFSKPANLERYKSDQYNL